MSDIDSAVRRRLIGRIRTIVSKMDEIQYMIEEHNLWNEMPDGWQNAQQSFIRWLMERGG